MKREEIAQIWQKTRKKKKKKEKKTFLELAKGFWRVKIIDVSKRAKWDAWKKLGNMTTNEAMFSYVEHFKKVHTSQIKKNFVYESLVM